MKNTGKLLSLDQANARLQDKYPDLVFIEYNGSKSLSIVSSNSCGHIWKGSLSNILSGIGGYICRICSPVGKTLEVANTKLTTKYPELEFLDYSGSNSNATVRSRLCGHTWNVRPRNVLSGHSGYICRVCTPAINSKLTLGAANLRLSEISPDLEFIEYNGLQVSSLVKSRTCNHTWYATLNNLTTGNSPITCPECYPRFNGISKGEKEIVEYIKSIYNGWIIENDRVFISPLELDIIVPDKGLAIEFNGEYWHREDPTIHINKTKLVEAEQYKLVHIFYREWASKKDIVKSRLAHALGCSQKIYARNTIVRVIAFPRDFLEVNHIQGAGAPSSVNLGLFLEGALVAVMTFSKPRFTTQYDYELVRYCSLLHTSIIGGASKLLNYFNNNFIGSIISYSDRRWGTGELYKILGFKYSHTTVPNYRYYNNNSSLSRYQCQKHLLETKFPKYYNHELTEHQIMALAGYYRVYDCGNDVWIYE